MNLFDVLVAEFRESIKPAISMIISLLRDSDSYVRMVCADALSELSKHGKVSKFLS